MGGSERLILFCFFFLFIEDIVLELRLTDHRYLLHSVYIIAARGSCWQKVMKRSEKIKCKHIGFLSIPRFMAHPLICRFCPFLRLALAFYHTCVRNHIVQTNSMTICTAITFHTFSYDNNHDKIKLKMKMNREKNKTRHNNNQSNVWLTLTTWPLIMPFYGT